MDKENVLGPGDDWEQAPPTGFYGDVSGGQKTSGQPFGCVWCLMDGVMDAPESVLMFKGSVACMDHLQQLIEAGNQ